MKDQVNVFRFEGEELNKEWVMDKLTHLSVLLKDDVNESIRIEMIEEFIDEQNNKMLSMRNCMNCDNFLNRSEYNKRCNTCNNNSNWNK